MRARVCAGALVALAGPAAAQESADRAAPARQLAITGLAEASYSYSSRGEGDPLALRGDYVDNRDGARTTSDGPTPPWPALTGPGWPA